MRIKDILTGLLSGEDFSDHGSKRVAKTWGPLTQAKKPW